MASTLPTEQLFLSTVAAKDDHYYSTNLHAGGVYKVLDGSERAPFATPSYFDRSLSQSSLESNASSFFTRRTISSFTDASSNDNSPCGTPPKDTKSSDTCYFLDALATGKRTPSALYELYRKSVPEYRVNSITCPRPPITYRPRPLTKHEVNREAAFHAKIKGIYHRALCYEERVAEDPCSIAFLGYELSTLKIDLWEYHMRETFPAPPAPTSELFDHIKSGWDVEELLQVSAGVLVLFFAGLIPFMLSGFVTRHQ